MPGDAQDNDSQGKGLSVRLSVCLSVCTAVKPIRHIFLVATHSHDPNEGFWTLKDEKNFPGKISTFSS